MSDALPQRWVWAEMQDICSKVQDGTHFSPKEQSSVGDYKYITAKNIKSWGVDLTNVTYVSEKVHRPIYERCNPEKGDVLYIKDGATTGIATVNTLDEEFSLLSSVALFKPIRGVLEPHYLKWYLNSPDGFKAMTDQMTGSAITRLVLRTLRKSRIPIAPLPEQRRIVAKLETLSGKVAACQQRLTKTSVLLKRFRQSVLAAACSGRLTADWRQGRTTDCTDDTDKKASVKSAKSVIQNLVRVAAGSTEDLPDGWQNAGVGDVVEGLKYGTAQKCSYENRGVPVLRIPNIADGIISHSDLKYAELPEKEFQQLRLRPRDILLIRSNGSVSLVGKCALARKADRDFAYAGYLIRLRPDTAKVSPEFLNLALGSYDVRKQIEIPARSTSGVNNINTEEIRALQFSLPPLPEQQEIVRRVEGLFALADQLEERLAKARGYVNKLTPSLLARAFAGQLVPQNPTDEPAEKLLSRIHSRQTETEKPKHTAS